MGIAEGRHMTTTRKIQFWILGTLAFFVFLYLVRSILLPFVVGMGVAYFLDPIVDRLEARKLSRLSATLIVLAFFFAIAGAIGAFLLPILYQQTIELAHNIPDYLIALREEYAPLVQSWLARIDPNPLGQVQQSVNGFSDKIPAMLTGILENIWQSGRAVISLLSLLFITPIVAFYLLRDFDILVTHIDRLLPRDHADTIREQMRRIDQTLSGYVRGQFTVCLVLAAAYAIALSLIGLDYAALIGISAGLLAFLPYVGVLFGMAASLAIAFYQFDDPARIGMVAGVFLIAQFLEGNFITPRVIGGRVNLHPAWLIFGLLAGGALFGFVGLLLAVPVTAILGVLARFATEQYTKSALYTGVKS